MKSGFEIGKELSKKHRKVDEVLKENFGEITAMAEMLMEDIDQLEEEANKKIEAYAYVIGQLKDEKAPFAGVKKHHYKKYKDAIGSLKTISKNIDSVKERMLKLFDLLDVDSIETEFGKIWVQEYESASVGDLSEDEKQFLVENGYAEWQLKLDKNKIITDLKEGKKHSDMLQLLPIKISLTKTIRGV